MEMQPPEISLYRETKQRYSFYCDSVTPILPLVPGKVTRKFSQFMMVTLKFIKVKDLGP